MELKEFSPGKFFAGLVTLAVALFAIFLAREQVPQGQQPGQAPEAPGMSGASALQPTQPEPRSIQQFLPEAQQNVSLGEATANLEIGTLTDTPGFDREELRARPGQVVSLTFRNLSRVSHQHSWVLTRPGMDQEVGVAAQKAGPEAGFIPVLPQAIVAHTRLLYPGESQTIVFRVPKQPGEYPFICSSPGHWEVMKGKLVVE